MRYLYKIFREKEFSQFEQEYELRLQSASTQHFGLKIKPLNQPHIYELYYIPTNQMIHLISKIHVVSRALNRNYNALPSIAKNQFITESLVEELFHTNDLEGIKSSREEIARSTKEIKLNNTAKLRFNSMIQSYMSLVDGKINLPGTPYDIRKLYDEITSGEIDNPELPDGVIFRKDTTFVYKQSGSEKIIHQGLTPESRINDEIKNMIQFMNQEHIPMLIKTAVSHYFFGYIHPFYDGNGRTARFITSMYLHEELGDIGALSLSRACNTNKSTYLKAFERANSMMNRGEMNDFIESFLTILLDALTSMNTEMKEKYELMTIALEKIENDSLLNDKPVRYKDTLFIIAQNYFFDPDQGITVKELSAALEVTDQTVRNTLRKLADLNLVKHTGKRPVYYRIPSAYFEE